MSRDEELRLFRRLAECRRRLLALVLQSAAGLRELRALCKAHLRTQPDADETRWLVTWHATVQRLQARALPLWTQLEAASEDAQTNEVAEGIVPALQHNREQILEATDEAHISSELKRGLCARALASLAETEDDAELPARTCVLLAWVREVEREIAGLETHIVAANQGLVCVVMKRYLRLGLALPDLLQEGNIGLMRAMEKFDPERGVRFNTYAGWWIRQSMRRALSNQSRTIRVPVHISDAQYVIGRAHSRLTAKLGRTPSSDELAADTGFRKEQLSRMASTVKEPVSLEAPRGSDEEVRLLDLLPDDTVIDADESTAADQRKKCIEELLSDLSPREQVVMRMRFGFEGTQEGCTLEEVGKALGVTRERARQILKSSLTKLRRAAVRRNIDISLLS